jgi:hypothetical protein
MVDGTQQPKAKPRARTAKTAAAPKDPRTNESAKARRATTGRTNSKVDTLTVPVGPGLSDDITGGALRPPIDPSADPSFIPGLDPVPIPVIVSSADLDLDLVPTFAPDEPVIVEPSAAPDVTEVVVVPSVLVPAVFTDSEFIDSEFTDSDGTDGLPSLQRPKKPPRALRPVTLRNPRRPRVRRVTRVVRQVDTWSVFKVALVFSLFLYAVCLAAGVLLWQVAQNTGTVDNVERFFESFGWQTFKLKGGEIFHNAWVGGLFLVVGLTGLLVLGATLFNLITDLVGGIRVTVLEEEVVAREDRGLGWRRAKKDAPVVATEVAEVPAEPI